MNREETVKYLYDLLKKHSVKVNEVDVIPVSSCIALVDDLIEHETDLLKEFVEWYKSKVIKDRIQVSKEQEEYCYEIGEPIKAIFWENESKVLQRISYCLNDDLEKFLGERK